MNGIGIVGSGIAGRDTIMRGYASLAGHAQEQVNRRDG